MTANCSIYYNDGVMRPIIVVLLGCYGNVDREKDIQQVVEWYVKNGNKEKLEIKEEGKRIKT